MFSKLRVIWKQTVRTVIARVRIKVHDPRVSMEEHAGRARAVDVGQLPCDGAHRDLEQEILIWVRPIPFQQWNPVDIMTDIKMDWQANPHKTNHAAVSQSIFSLSIGPVTN